MDVYETDDSVYLYKDSTQIFKFEICNIYIETIPEDIMLFGGTIDDLDEIPLTADLSEVIIGDRQFAVYKGTVHPLRSLKQDDMRHYNRIENHLKFDGTNYIIVWNCEEGKYCFMVNNQQYNFLKEDVGKLCSASVFVLQDHLIFYTYLDGGIYKNSLKLK